VILFLTNRRGLAAEGHDALHHLDRRPAEEDRQDDHHDDHQRPGTSSEVQHGFIRATAASAVHRAHGEPRIRSSVRSPSAPGRPPSAATNPRTCSTCQHAREPRDRRDAQVENPPTPRGTGPHGGGQGVARRVLRNENPVFQSMYSGKRAIGRRPEREECRAGDVAEVRQWALLSRYGGEARDSMGRDHFNCRRRSIGVLCGSCRGSERRGFFFFFCSPLFPLLVSRGTSGYPTRTNRAPPLRDCSTRASRRGPYRSIFL